MSHHVGNCAILLAMLLNGLAAAQSLPPGGMSAIKPPYVIAHRGGPLLWPEHTMEAYRASTEAGNPFVEVDCFVLRDGSVVIMHDNELQRTTTGNGLLTSINTKDLQGVMVDGERLLGPGWGKYHIPFFDEVLVRYGNKKVLFAEVKTRKGGRAIAEKLKQYNIKKDYVIVNSFYPEELSASRGAGYEVCLNLRPDDRYTADQLAKMKLWGVACYTNVPKDYVRSLKKAGLVVLIYTPGNHYERDASLAKGADGFYCDDPVYMALDTSYRRTEDPFALQKWYAGMLPAQNGGRGRFTPPDMWGIDTSTENVFRGCLQGWLAPIRDGKLAESWSVEFTVKFGVGLMEGRWASLGVFTTDQPLETDSPGGGQRGFNYLLHNSGSISIYKYDGTPGKPPELLGTTPNGKVEVGAVRSYRITITKTQIRAECFENGATLVVDDDSQRGAYITMGAKGQRADFLNVRLNTLK